MKLNKEELRAVLNFNQFVLDFADAETQFSDSDVRIYAKITARALEALRDQQAAQHGVAGDAPRP